MTSIKRELAQNSRIIVDLNDSNQINLLNPKVDIQNHLFRIILKLINLYLIYEARRQSNYSRSS